MYDPDRTQQCFICLIRKVRNPPAIPLSEEELHLLHRAFVQTLSDRRLLFSSGPARGDTGAHEGSIVVLRVPTRADAERLLGEDPNIVHGQRRAEIVPWQRRWFEDEPISVVKRR